jgi:hypothetical protein
MTACRSGRLKGSQQEPRNQAKYTHTIGKESWVQGEEQQNVSAIKDVVLKKIGCIIHFSSQLFLIKKNAYLRVSHG